VAFVPNTHYLFSAGRDGLVKYWDADRWELLLQLDGHKAEVRAQPPASLTCCSILYSCAHAQDVGTSPRLMEPSIFLALFMPFCPISHPLYL
jgi:U3 small nucleolar RNA-associated protein 12